MSLKLALGMPLKLALRISLKLPAGMRANALVGISVKLFCGILVKPVGGIWANALIGLSVKPICGRLADVLVGSSVMFPEPDAANLLAVTSGELSIPRTGRVKRAAGGRFGLAFSVTPGSPAEGSTPHSASDGSDFWTTQLIVATATPPVLDTAWNRNAQRRNVTRQTFRASTKNLQAFRQNRQLSSVKAVRARIRPESDEQELFTKVRQATSWPVNVAQLPSALPQNAHDRTAAWLAVSKADASRAWLAETFDAESRNVPANWNAIVARVEQQDRAEEMPTSDGPAGVEMRMDEAIAAEHWKNEERSAKNEETEAKTAPPEPPDRQFMKWQRTRWRKAETSLR
jgi:hypothetical protein